MQDKGYLLIAIGWTTELDPQKRLDCYAKKYPVVSPRPIHIIATNNKKLEGFIQRNRPLDVIPAGGKWKDLFWIKPEHIKLIEALSTTMLFDDMNGRIVHWKIVEAVRVEQGVLL